MERKSRSYSKKIMQELQEKYKVVVFKMNEYYSKIEKKEIYKDGVLIKEDFKESKNFD